MLIIEFIRLSVKNDKQFIMNQWGQRDENFIMIKDLDSIRALVDRFLD